MEGENSAVGLWCFVWGGCGARLGSRRCDRVERRAAFEGLGRVVSLQAYDEVRLKRSRAQGVGVVKVRIQGRRE